MVNLTCSANFFGEWPPDVQWEQVLGSETKILTENASWFRTDAALHSTLLIWQRDVYENIKYQAVLRFLAKDKPKTVTATNIPDHEQTWIYQSMEQSEFNLRP